MCNFFSFLSNGNGKYFYADKEIRQKMNGTSFKPDSHSSIVAFFQKDGKIAIGNNVEDKFNKYEFNPITNKFKIDQINGKDDSRQAEGFVRVLDFKEIIPELNIKNIIHPFKDIQKRRISKKKIQLLKKWDSIWDSFRDSFRDSVRDSVWDSIWDSIWDSFRDSFRDSVRDSVWDSVWDSVRDSVWDSVRDSVWDSFRDSVWDSFRDSVWDSVWDSFRDSVYAYTSSFFNLKRWKGIEYEDFKNPFRPCIDLWEDGCVPSFDGKIWRLHSGKNSDIIFEISKKDLKNA